MTRMERRKLSARRLLMKLTVVVTVVLVVTIALVSWETTGKVAERAELYKRPLELSYTVFQPEVTELLATTLEYEKVISAERAPVSRVEPTPKRTEEPEPEVEVVQLYTERDVIALAQMAYGEAWVTQSDTEMSAAMWSALNRFDSGDPFYAECESIYDIVAQYRQYHGYDPDHPQEERLINLARDVLERWQAERYGATDVGRTLPAEYLFFWGDGRHNHYTTEYHGGIEYDWSLDSPYDN